VKKVLHFDRSLFCSAKKITTELNVSDTITSMSCAAFWFCLG